MITEFHRDYRFSADKGIAEFETRLFERNVNDGITERHRPNDIFDCRRVAGDVHGVAELLHVNDDLTSPRRPDEFSHAVAEFHRVVYYDDDDYRTSARRRHDRNTAELPTGGYRMSGTTGIDDRGSAVVRSSERPRGERVTAADRRTDGTDRPDVDALVARDRRDDDLHGDRLVRGHDSGFRYRIQ